MTGTRRNPNRHTNQMAQDVPSGRWLTPEMAASHLIRVALANLHEYMKEIGNDITQFNEHVRMHLNALSARGEKTSEFDLLHNLFEAYLVCPDTRFKAYMTDIQSKYEDGEFLVHPNKTNGQGGAEVQNAM